jgi:hypothetical protein
VRLKKNARGYLITALTKWKLIKANIIQNRSEAGATFNGYIVNTVISEY